ncbi:hypothetical protein ACC807_37680, partial [Rhizobium ruizarguesonis]
MDDKGWPLDWEAGSNHFLDLFEGWASLVDSTSAQGLIPLLLSWAGYDTLGSQFQRGAEILRANHLAKW